MKTNELKNKIDLSDKVFAHGPLTLQPGTLPYRVVLMDLGDKWAVYNQIWTEYETEPELKVMGPFELDNGDYFATENLTEATIRLVERIRRNAEYIRSIYEKTQGVEMQVSTLFDYLRATGWRWEQSTEGGLITIYNEDETRKAVAQTYWDGERGRSIQYYRLCRLIDGEWQFHQERVYWENVHKFLMVSETVFQ